MSQNLQVSLIRVPHSYKYNDLDVTEEAILTYLAGYFDSIGFHNYSIHDFHLQRDLSLADIVSPSVTDYILSVRETGEQVHYIQRLVRALRAQSAVRIILYGQTARLSELEWPENVVILKHREQDVAETLGLDFNGPSYGSGLIAKPYFDQISLAPWQRRRFKAAIETTRGCHFGCRFCFINAGDNYGKRWQMRPNDDILADLRAYRKLGIRSVAFRDSEFFGPHPKFQAGKRDLLNVIKAELPGTSYMIWARADTLLSFNDFDLLKSSGLVNTFIGVESFSQDDLNALGKGLQVEDSVRCIKELRDRGIHAYLSFIVFNRNTCVDSLRVNLLTLRHLRSKNSRCLGLPYFTFSFESDWKGNVNSGVLSGRTYIGTDVAMKSQPAALGVCFNPKLEPLVELCRLLTYEWSKKATQLNHARDGASSEVRNAIEAWFTGLGDFCIEVMEALLQEYDSAQLSLDNLLCRREQLFEDIQTYYVNHLPVSLRALSTYSDHASQMSYAENSELVEEDEYWEKQIPFYEQLPESVSCQ
jgi:hypothetical protein